MFYSTDLLTNRQHGVATIWLVATLGSQSNLKKVTRKAILDVNVPKACDRITDPSAPLALRLQGSLLYGVSRVHSQQCMYVLADTQSFRDKMRGIAQIMKELEIDPDIGKMRSEQLNLPQDPAFIPDLDMNFDLAAFDIPSHSGTSPVSSALSSPTPASSHTSLASQVPFDEEEPGIELPSMDTSGGFGGFDLNLEPGGSSAVKTGSKAGAADVFEESAIIENPDFEVAEDGSIIAIPTDRVRESEVSGGRAASESDISARVRAEHEAGLVQTEPLLMGFDADAPMLFGDDEPLPHAEPFPPVDREGSHQQPEPSVQPSHESTTTTTAEAPQRRVRQAKQLQVDDHAEITNRQLGEWNTNYLANMNAMSRTKEQNKSTVQAKKNAAFWILGQGIGGVEVNFGTDHFPHPLAVFSGQDLLDALTGGESSAAGSKRTRSGSWEAGDEVVGRRVRPKGEDEDEIARGEEGEIPGFDDDGILPQEDDYNIESEVGRRAPSSLREQSSAMPWNMSSRGGSLQPLGSAGPGMSSSVAGAGALPPGPPSALSRRGSRLTSASPLVGKGPRLPRVALEDDDGGPEEQGVMLGDDDMASAGAVDIDDYELYGPSAAVDTQTAAQSQWLKTTLENEAYNFLTFLETQLQVRGEEGEGVKSITLDELLPPANNTQVVGAQAMLHVLALTTKGLIEVEQQEAFGDIRMRVVHAKAQPAEEHDEEME